jgi:hypothetical protein
MPYGSTLERLLGLAGYRLKGELGRNRDCVPERPVDRATILIKAVNPLGGLAIGRGSLQVHPDMNPADHQHAILQLDLADRLCRQPIARRGDLARLQRASKGSGQSARGRGNHVVQSRRMRWGRVGRNLIVLRDRAVDTEDDRLILGRQVSLADGTLHSLDSDMRSVDDIAHARSSRDTISMLI